jgi:hypothetical protein
LFIRQTDRKANVTRVTSDIKKFFAEAIPGVKQAGRKYPFMYYLCPYRSRLTDFPYPGHGYFLTEE